MISKRFATLVAVFVLLATVARGSGDDTRTLHAGQVVLSDGVHTATLTPGTLSGNTTFTFPPSNGTAGYFLSTDGGGVLSWLTRTITTTAPLQGGGNLTANRTFSITQASTSTDGYVSSTDWNTFNNKPSTSTTINTTAPLQGGGDLSTNRTFSMTQAATAANGYVSSTDWNTFNSKQQAITVGAIGAATTNGVTLSAGTLALGAADGTHGGAVTSGTQTFGGAKTFSNNLTVQGNYALSGGAAYALTADSTTTGSNANFSFVSAYTRATNASLSSIATLDTTNATSGQVVTIINGTGGTITLVDNYSTPPGSSAVIRTGTGANVTIADKGVVNLVYSTAANVWYVAALNSGQVFALQSRNVNTTAPLQGGGDLSADRTLSMTQAATAANGYLSSTDWNTFNGKQSALSGTADQVLVIPHAGGSPTFGQVDLSQSAAIKSTLPTGNGGTGVASVTTTPAATAFAGWDANKNLSANSLIEGYTTTVTAAATTTLTVGSTYQQFFTGTTTQTVALPVTSTLVLGQAYQVYNNSTGTVTVQSSGGNTVKAMGAASTATFTVVSTSGTGASSWNVEYAAQSSGTVSSVAITGAGGIFSISGSPITTSGTIAESVAGTSGGVPYFSDGSTLSSSGALTNKGVVLGGGSGAAPTSTAAGTDGQILIGNTSAAPTWGNSVSAATTFSGGVVFGNGATNFNWYEENTCASAQSGNPIILGGLTTNPTVTYSNQTCLFTRIGRVVYIYGLIQWSAYSNGVGRLEIKRALPYNSNSTASLFSTCTIEQSNLVATSGDTQIAGEIGPNSSVIDLYSVAPSAGTTSNAVSSVGQHSSGYIVFSCFYFI